MLLAHLLVHTVDGFLAPADRGDDARSFQALADRLQDALHDFAAIATRGLDLLGQHPVAHRVQILERQFL